MMKTKLFAFFCAELLIIESSSRIHTLPSGLLVSLGLNTLAVITFSEKLAFPRGAALRITELYAKMFQRLLRKAVESVCLSLLRLALREAKAVTSATRGGTPRLFSTVY